MAPTAFRRETTDPEVLTMNPMGLVTAIGVGIVMATSPTPRPHWDIQATVAPDPNPTGVRAFPEAEGFGAMALSSCDRQRLQIFAVTNTNDSGPGSFRQALAEAESSPEGELKVVILRVGGYIDTTTEIRFGGDCLYIAGQTAPGDGVTIRGRGLEFHRGARDIAVRFLRIRLGGGRNGIIVRQGTNLIFDHLSVSWSGQTLIRFSRTQIARSGPTSNVTVQRSLLGESLSSHPTALQIGGQPDTDHAGNRAGWRDQTNFSIHHNLIASNHHRNINARGIGIEIINNLVHNWGLDAGQTGAGAQVDWVSNYFQKGPMSRDAYHPITVRTRDVLEPPFYRPSIHAAGNVSLGGSHRSDQNSDPTADNWEGPTNLVNWYHNDHGAGIELRGLRRAHRISAPEFPVTVQDPFSARMSVLNDVGATRGLDCKGDWVPRVDPVDRRMIREAHAGKGPSSIRDDAGSFPPLVAEPPCIDSDGDGIPDEWKVARGLDPGDPSVANRIGAGGYSYLEHYLNGTTP